MADESSISLRDLGQKAFKGAVSLGVRQFFVHGLHLITGILLARWLEPRQFGALMILQFLSVLFNNLTDLGLNYRLIQQKKDPEETEYRAVFTFQLMSGALITAVVWITVPVLAGLFSITSISPGMIQVISLVTLAYPFVMVPISRLERNLEFKKVAYAEIMQVAIFSLTTIFMIRLGFGAWSIVAGILGRYYVSAPIICWISKWLPALHLNFLQIKQKLSKGLFYQGGIFLALAREGVIPLFVGHKLGAAAVGHAQWAATMAGYPIYAQNIFTRVYLPTFAKLQTNYDELSRALERIISWTNRLMSPMIVGLVLFAKPITIIIFTEKWLPTLPMVYIMAIANSVVATMLPCHQMLNSLGLSKVTFKVSLIWITALWIFSIVLVPRYGYMGVGWAFLGATPLYYFLFKKCIEYVHPKIFLAAIYPWLLSLIAAGIYFPIRNYFIEDKLSHLLIGVVFFLTSYAVLTILFFRKRIVEDLKLLVK